MSDVLLTGFAPWAEFRNNPSGDVARALGGHVLPVDYRRADAALKRLFRAKPAAVVMTGLAARRTSIQIERRARNRHDDGEPIEMGGPAWRASSLPDERLLALLRRAGLSAELSENAGTFLCNHVFYVARGLLRGVPCGFVHLPPVEVLPLAEQLRGVRIILEALGWRE